MLMVIANGWIDEVFAVLLAIQFPLLATANCKFQDSKLLTQQLTYLKLILLVRHFVKLKWKTNGN